MPGAAWRSATGRSRAVQRQQALRSGVGGPIAGCHQGCAPCRWPRTSSAPVATVPGHPRGQVPLELAGRYPLASAILGRTSRLWTLGALGRLVVVTGPPKHCGSFLSRAGAYGRHQSAEDRAAWARPARGRRPCGGVRRAEQFLQSLRNSDRAQLRRLRRIKVDGPPTRQLFPGSSRDRTSRRSSSLAPWLDRAQRELSFPVRRSFWR